MKQSYNERYNRWYDGYIDGVDLSNIEWRRFNYEQLIAFYYQNYYDEDYESFIMEIDDVNDRYERNRFFPIGMTYLTFNKESKHNEYIVGIAKNKLGLYTIVASMIFVPKLLIEDDCINAVTYIETVETNKYFQNCGIFKQMIEVLLRFINANQDILITHECGVGEKVGVISIMKKILKEQNFLGEIRSEYEITEEYLEKLRGRKVKKKVLK